MERVSALVAEHLPWKQQQSLVSTATALAWLFSSPQSGQKEKARLTGSVRWFLEFS